MLLIFLFLSTAYRASCSLARHILNFFCIHLSFAAFVSHLWKTRKKTHQTSQLNFLVNICSSRLLNLSPNSLVEWVHPLLLFSPHNVHTSSSTVLIMLNYNGICLSPPPTPWDCWPLRLAVVSYSARYLQCPAPLGMGKVLYKYQMNDCSMGKTCQQP